MATEAADDLQRGPCVAPVRAAAQDDIDIAVVSLMRDAAFCECENVTVGSGDDRGDAEGVVAGGAAFEDGGSLKSAMAGKCECEEGE